MYNIDNYPSGGDLFLLLANCLLLFCMNLAVLIYPTLLADIKRPNSNSAQGPHPVGRVTYMCPLNCFTLIYNPNLT